MLPLFIEPNCRLARYIFIPMNMKMIPTFTFSLIISDTISLVMLDFCVKVLVVLGAAGGVGLAAVQIGKVLGATVIAVARYFVPNSATH